ncbi:hypothetical protein B0T21DRAFT_350545 [Apiosordaria backusii]|uniref:Uncharacterized protein n=1 Tax=Apiosordaria backusii TaxID=314023 RepID=A0AA40E390_9PEZI|nr:hypothetical protein B0T21DRAFT_350545 [Apiosordaria backusii]
MARIIFDLQFDRIQPAQFDRIQLLLVFCAGWIAAGIFTSWIQSYIGSITAEGLLGALQSAGPRVWGLAGAIARWICWSLAFAIFLGGAFVIWALYFISVALTWLMVMHI